MKKAHKLLILISILTVMLVAKLNGQEITPAKKQPFVFNTQQEAIGTAKVSTFYVVVKGVKYFYYKTTRGSYYSVIPQANGTFRRQYEASLKGK